MSAWDAVLVLIGGVLGSLLGGAVLAWTLDGWRPWR